MYFSIQLKTDNAYPRNVKRGNFPDQEKKTTQFTLSQKGNLHPNHK